MIRSVLAVLAGIVVLTVVSFAIEAGADPLLMHLFPRALPDSAALAASSAARLFMLTYTTFSIAVGGYVTAWIARRAPLAHAAIMGAIEVALTLYVMIAAPFAEAHRAPRWGWSWVLGMILMIPAACLGAAIRVRHARPHGWSRQVPSICSDKSPGGSSASPLGVELLRRRARGVLYFWLCGKRSSPAQEVGLSQSVVVGVAVTG